MTLLSGVRSWCRSYTSWSRYPETMGSASTCTSEYLVHSQRVGIWQREVRSSRANHAIKDSLKSEVGAVEKVLVSFPKVSLMSPPS